MQRSHRRRRHRTATDECRRGKRGHAQPSPDPRALWFLAILGRRSADKCARTSQPHTQPGPTRPCYCWRGWEVTRPGAARLVCRRRVGWHTGLAHIVGIPLQRCALVWHYLAGVENGKAGVKASRCIVSKGTECVAEESMPQPTAHSPHCRLCRLDDRRALNHSTEPASQIECRLDC